MKSNGQKIYRPLLKGINWALAGLLGALGFAIVSCSTTEYGSPYALFTIKGKVTDTQGTAIRGIEVKGVDDAEKEWRKEFPPNYPYKALTDDKGEYAFTIRAAAISNLTVYATDIDSDANGAYQPDSAFVEGSELTLKGGDKNWFLGRAETTVDFTLKEEKEKEE